MLRDYPVLDDPLADAPGRSGIEGGDFTGARRYRAERARENGYRESGQ